jgi:hypothetical protein
MRESGRDALRPVDLLELFPAMRLAIVQPPLLLTPPDARRTGDREDAMLVRRYAGELFYLGVPAVVVLPRLQAPIASVVVSHLARVIRRQRQHGTRALEHAMHDIQRQLLRVSAPPDVVHETLLDVCLFCTDDFDGNLGSGSNRREL